MLRQAAACLRADSQIQLRLVVYAPWSCAPNQRPVAWDRGMSALRFLCDRLHVPGDQVSFCYGTGDSDSVRMEWEEKSLGLPSPQAAR